MVIEGIEVQLSPMRDVSGGVVAKLIGYLDKSNSRDVYNTFMAIMDSGSINFMLDFSKFIFTTGSDLFLLFRIWKELKNRGGNLVVMNMAPNLREVVDLLGFTDTLIYADSIQEAVRMLSRGSYKSDSDTSGFMPTFLQKLQHPSIKNILMVGCGGGFDFVHSMFLYSELKKLGKNIVIGSYSWTTTYTMPNEIETVFEWDDVKVKRVNAHSPIDPLYSPEIHLCGFLDAQYPNDPAHSVYTYCARDFTVSVLTKFYKQLVHEHNIDCIVVFDGGADGLMRGDEAGLGDPVEDFVSITTVAGLAEVKERILVSIGIGTDRGNGISDASALRAITELTKMNGFLGSMSLEVSSSRFKFYKQCIEYIFNRQLAKSGCARQIISAIEGDFGLNEDGLCITPLMAMIWAFEINTVAERSLISKWVKDGTSTKDNWRSVIVGRKNCSIREIENLPLHQDLFDENNNLFILYDLQHSFGTETDGGTV